MAIIKPHFYWGPMVQSQRIARKHFAPTTDIRSQQCRRRKLLDVKLRSEETPVEDVESSIQANAEDRHELVTNIAELQIYFRNMFKKSAKIERKGRIFSDSLYFENLDVTSELIMNSRWKGALYL